jgi:hypothetical protein
MAKASKGDVASWLRGRAMRHAGVEESVTGAGTPSEASTYTAGGKAFLFIAPRDEFYELRLKLGASKAEASRLSSKSADRFAIGATGWAKITFPKSEAGPRPILERWIDESHALFVPANSKAAPGKAKSLPMVKPAVLAKKAKPAARAKR